MKTCRVFDGVRQNELGTPSFSPPASNDEFLKNLAHRLSIGSHRLPDFHQLSKPASSA